MSKKNTVIGAAAVVVVAGVACCFKKVRNKIFFKGEKKVEPTKEVEVEATPESVAVEEVKASAEAAAPVTPEEVKKEISVEEIKASTSRIEKEIEKAKGLRAKMQAHLDELSAIEQEMKSNQGK